MSTTHAPPAHEHAARLRWTGNTGGGTSSYATYGRGYEIEVEGKPALLGTADPAFRGDPARHNPEDHFLAALSGCHMLSYLALCARRGVRVTEYTDDVRGTLELDGRGGGRFREVTLRPAVTVADAATAELARRLHETAHELCFIAGSCRVPIRVLPVVRAG